MSPHQPVADDVTSAGEVPAKSEERRRSSDAGFVLAWFALMAVVLVGFAGFAVDVGHWYLTASRLQNTADASALGGVVFLPDDLSNATEVATDLANGHGYEDFEVTVTRGDRPNQLRVTVTHEVSNFFVSLFGLNTTTITRTALAEFEGPVPMGSPENFLGNDPERGVLPDHWMNAGSVRNNVGNGDRYNNGRNSGNESLGASVNLPGGITSPDFRPEGVFYAVEVAPGTTGPLVVQVFDPALYEVGDTCGSNPGAHFNAALPDLQALALADPNIPDDWYSNTARYGNYATSPRWCTGDFIAGGTSGGSGPATTSYIMREPDGTPWLDNDNPVVSHSSCQPRQFRGMSAADLANGGGLNAKLLDAAGQGRVTFPTGAWQQTVANSFRRWVTVCEIPNPIAGTYLLQVRTSVPFGQDPATYSGIPDDTWGHNRFSLRAGIGSDPDVTGWSTGISLFAQGRMPIYVNANGADTVFYLARVLPSGTQRVLNVSLWDISDIGNSGTMRIVPPPDANVDSFSGCQFGKSGGTYTTNPGDCSFGFNASSLNEQLVQVGIPLPDGYDCNRDDPFGCWIRVETPVTGDANDTTTWSANIVGDPVRLVE